ncbi:hypothetical protein GCM10022286_00770 [Gryllotalpicola daejeonensis]|uniref:Uncharacterized protein n=1 Tax=Gryllotalpicola daejeonensis TaxID=993087 RepID=A0ABP7ZCU7_9MICO
MSTLDPREAAKKLAAIRRRQGGSVSDKVGALASKGVNSVTQNGEPKSDAAEAGKEALKGAIKGAAVGGVHGAAVGAAKSLVTSKAGRKWLIGLLSPLVAMGLVVGVIGQAFTSLVANAQTSIQSQQIDAAETNGFTADQVSDAEDAVENTDVPVALALAYAKVEGKSMTHAQAEDLAAGVSSDKNLDLSLTSYLTVSDDSMTIDDSHKDDVDAVGKLWSAALESALSVSGADAATIWAQTVALITGEVNSCPADTGTTSSSAGGSGAGGLSSIQIAHATQIISDIRGLLTDDNEARTASIDALDSALTESSLKMYANSTVPDSLNYPHDAVGSDHDSVGFFQMRANGGNWGTVAELMDADQNVIRYLGGPFKPADEHSTSTLLDQPGWVTLAPDAASQAVEVSAYPTAYTPNVATAESLVDELWSKATPSTTIKALDDSMLATAGTPAGAPSTGSNGASAGDSTSVCGAPGADVATDQKALAEQIVTLEGQGKVSYWANPDSSVPLKSEVDNIASGKATSDCFLGTSVLEAILVAQHAFGSVQVNDLNRTCEHDGTDASIQSAHFVGMAVDFGELGGQYLTGGDARSAALLQILDPMVPKAVGAWAGQVQCKAASGVTLPLTNITQGDDSCTHQHVDFGHDAKTNAPLDEGKFEQSMALPEGWAVPSSGAGGLTR